jgi:hypothetical protein
MVAPLFEARPTQVDDASQTRAWLFDEVATFVDQTVGEMTVDVARFLTGPMHAEVLRRWVQAGRTVRFVHDWRSCTTYDSEARRLIIDWGRASLAHTRQVLIQLSPQASPFVRIAASTGVSVLRAARMPISVVNDLEPVRRELAGLAPL